VHQERIIFFAFRKSQKRFFETLIKECNQSIADMVDSKRLFLFSFRAWKDRHRIDTVPACRFAVDEFYAKTGMRIPRGALQPFFRLLAFVNFLRYSKVLQKGYHKMLIWNGGKFRQLIAIEAAKLYGVRVYYFENGLLPNTLVFDPKGINYHNSVPRERSFFEAYESDVQLPQSLVPRIGKNREAFQGEGGALPEKYIFVPFQVDYDTQIISQSPWIKDMRMLFEMIESLAKKSEYHFVLKEHPSSGVEYPDLHERIKHIPTMHFENRHSTQHLIENCSAVITVNSTVGIEALLFHKKVIVLGNAFYAIDGITTKVSNLKALQASIDHLEQMCLDTSLVDRFLKYLYHEYLIPKNDTMYANLCRRLEATV